MKPFSPQEHPTNSAGVVVGSLLSMGVIYEVREQVSNGVWRPLEEINISCQQCLAQFLQESVAR